MKACGAESSISERNPFVGPRSLQPGEALYGRAVEVRELFHRLQGRRILVLHSPSGAGKSSLVNAGLIPRLKENQFDVWKPIRVNLDPTGLDGVGPETNRYLLSAMLSLEEELPAERRRSPAQLAGLELSDYVSTRPRRKGSAQQSVVLLFDQFEEVLTLAPLAIGEKRAFFSAVGKALQREDVWALFIIREDHLPALAPYRDLVPTQLSNTFRLDLLSRNAARETAAQLALQGGRTFPAAERLMQDLATVQVQKADGSFVAEQGLYVEPVQLQVVCRRLWEAMPADNLSIEEDDVSQYADVTSALASYYADSVRKIAHDDVAVERALRDWVGSKLIVSGIRSQVRQEQGQSAGLDNALIGQLLGSYLVRSEPRAGATWYELSHDRLVAPVRKDNEAWERAHLHPLQVQARLWEAGRRNQALLLSAEALQDASGWAEQNPTLLTDAEREFLSATQVLRTEEARQHMRQRRFTQAIGAAGVVALAAALASFLLYRQAAQAALVARDTHRMWVAAGLVKSDVVASNTVLREVESTEAADWRALALDAQFRGMPRQELRGHEEKVTSLALSPDGKQIVTGSEDNSVCIWNVDGTGKPLILAGHTEPVRSVAFSHDGSWVASASDDHSVRVWRSDGSDRERPRVFDQHELPPEEQAEVRAVAFSRDDRLAYADYKGRIRLWKRDGSDWKLASAFDKHKKPVFALAFSPDGTKLASGSRDTQVIVWKTDGSDKDAPRVLEGHTDDVFGVAFSPDGKRLASASDDKTVRVWSLGAAAAKTAFLELKGHTDCVRSVAFRDGRQLASAADDETVRIWDLDEQGRSPLILHGHKNPVNAVAYSRDGRLLATGSNDATARVWNADGSGRDRLLGGHSEIVRAVAFSPDGTRLASGSDDASVLIVQVGGALRSHALKGHSGRVNTIAFSPDGKRLASGSLDGTIALWSVGDSDQTQPLERLPAQAEVWSVAVSPDGKLLAAATEAGHIQLWSIGAGAAAKLVRTLRGHKASIRAVAFSADGRLASGSADGTVQVWESGALDKPPAVLQADRAEVRALAFSRDGKWLAAGCSDKGVRVWSAAGTRAYKLAWLRQHDGAVFSVSFSRDSRLLATGSADHKVRLWPVSGEGEPRVLTGLDTEEFYAVAFSPDEERIALGSTHLPFPVRISMVQQPGTALRELLFQASPYCLEVSRRRLVLHETAEEAQAGYERCRAELARSSRP